MSSMSLSLPTTPIPTDLNALLPSPRTPWNLSDSLFQRVCSLQAIFQGAGGAGLMDTDVGFRTCEVETSDPEYEFIQRYFNHQKPPGCVMTRVTCIHNPIHTT